MRNALIFILLFAISAIADVKISQLPLGSGAAVGINDSFPFVSAGTGITKRLTIFDIVNVPLIAETFAPIESPVFTGPVGFEGYLIWAQGIDSTSTGAAQTITPTTSNVKVSNVSLTSIAGITQVESKVLIFVNGTGGLLTVLNESNSATAANRISTGTASDLQIADGQSLFLSYDTNSSRWRVIGGTGSSYEQVTYVETDGELTTLTATSPEVMEIIPSFTKMLMHYDSFDGDTTIVDEVGNVVTAHDGAAISTTEYVFGGSSLLLDGIDDYATMPSDAINILADQDFTFEVWMRLTEPQANYQMIFSGDLGNNYVSIRDIGLEFQSSGGLLQCLYTFDEDQWYHIAIVRQGGLITCYIDGVANNTSTQYGVWPDEGSTAYIGVWGSNATYYFPGYLDEMRLSRKAIYTANFTPPGSEFTYTYGTKNIRLPNASLLPIGKRFTIINAATEDVGIESHEAQPLLTSVSGHTSAARLLNNNSNSGQWVTNDLLSMVNAPVDIIGAVPMANGGTNTVMTASAGAVAFSDADSLELSAVGVAGQALVSGGSGTPTWFAPSASQAVITGADGILATEATLALSRGGTNKNFSPGSGAVIYFDSNSMEQTSVGNVGQILRSNNNAAPTWTSATYPSSTTANQILYSSATNVIGEITTAATSALVTNSSSVPALTSGAVANRVLRTDGTTVSFDQVALATDVSGILALANGGSNKNMTAVNGGIIWSDADSMEVTAAGTSGQILQSNGAAAPTWVNNSGGRDQSYEISNLSLASSVGASALTIAIKDKAGSDPSAGSPVLVGMRNATAATGTYNQRSITGALSLVVSSGSTLGQIAAEVASLWVYLIDNSGTLELAVSQTLFDETRPTVTTTAEGGAGAADSSTVMYSATARTNVPFRLIGKLLNTQATPGTWATTPSQLSVGNFGNLVSGYTTGIEFKDSSGLSISNSGAYVAIPFTSMDHETPYGTYNTSTGVYTVPENGKYVVTAQITYDNLAWVASNQHWLVIKIDGTQVKQNGSSIQGAFTGYVENTISASFNLSKGQTIAVGAGHNRTAGNATLIAATDYNHLTITKVSE